MAKPTHIAIATALLFGAFITVSSSGAANAEGCAERLAAFEKSSGGRTAKDRARRHADAAGQYDWQAEKWEELAAKAHTAHLEHAYRNEARGLRALADAEREKSMAPSVAEEALNADCGQQLAALSKIDEAKPEHTVAPAKPIETKTRPKAKAGAKPKAASKNKTSTKAKAKTRKRATSAKKRVKRVKKKWSRASGLDASAYAWSAAPGPGS